MPFISSDILILIAENLEDSEDYFRLMRVCRDWNTILAPRAYNRISLHELLVYPFVSHIYKNPDIGRTIRHLHVQWAPRWRGLEPDVEIVKDAVQRACDSTAERKKWTDCLQSGDSDAWLAILVQSLEGLISLSMDYVIGSDWFIPMIGRAALRQPPFDTTPVLQRLERVRIETDDMKTTFDARDFLPFFWLPAMRVFSGNRISEAYDTGDEDMPFPKPEPGTSGIKEIYLDGPPYIECNGSKGMANYITSCANLEVFEYEHGNDTIWGGLSLAFRPHEFYNALVTQKHSLRKLSLEDIGESTTDDCDDDDERDETWKFGSLAEFAQLRELLIPVRTILAFNLDDEPTVSLFDVLPPSLEYLFLTHYDDETFPMLIDDLQHMVEHRESKFPNLNSIRIQPESLEIVEKLPKSPYLQEWRIPMSMQENFAEFTQTCHNAGIRFWFCKER